MIRNLIRGVLFAAVLMMASSCALFRSGDRIRLTEKDSGRTLETEVGDVIEIAFGTKSVKVRVLDLQDTTKKEEAKDLFEYVS